MKNGWGGLGWAYGTIGATLAFGVAVGGWAVKSQRVRVLERHVAMEQRLREEAETALAARRGAASEPFSLEVLDAAGKVVARSSSPASADGAVELRSDLLPKGELTVRVSSGPDERLAAVRSYRVTIR